MKLEEIGREYFREGETVSVEGRKLQEIVRRMQHAEREVNRLKHNNGILSEALGKRPRYIDIEV